MRLFYNTNGFAHHRLEDVVALLADLGYDGVALTPDVHHLDPLSATAAQVDALAAHLQRVGLGITIEAGARFVLDPRRKHHPTLLSSDGFELRQRFYRRLIDLAVDLGSPLVSIWSGRRESDTPAGEAGHTLLAERLTPVLEHAAERGIEVCFEPEPGMLVETLDQYAALREELLPHRLFLTIDTGHLAASERPPFHGHVSSNAGPLRNVHLDDAPIGIHEHRFFGDGDLDLAAIATALREVEYAGPLAIELSRHCHDAARIARSALEKLRPLGF